MAVDEAAAATLKAENAAAEVGVKHAELLVKYAQLQAEATKAQALQKQALAAQQAEVIFQTADAGMLPEDVAPKTGEKGFFKVCGHLFQLMERWQFGGMISVTLAELSHHSLAKDTTQSLLKKLLGPQLWAGWFGTPDFTMADDSVLPRQTLMFLHLALKELKSHYEAGEDTKKAATKAYALMVEDNNKKRKVQT